MTTALTIGLASSLSVGSSMPTVWSVVNALQIITHLPLLPFDFPAHSLLFCKVMSNAVTFDQYIPDDDIATWINKGESADDIIAFNDRFDAMDYGTADFFDMMGDMLYYEWIFLAGTLVVSMMWRISSSKSTEPQTS